MQHTALLYGGAGGPLSRAFGDETPPVLHTKVQWGALGVDGGRGPGGQGGGVGSGGSAARGGAGNDGGSLEEVPARIAFGGRDAFGRAGPPPVWPGKAASHRTPPPAQRVYSDSVPKQGARRRERAASHKTPPAQDTHPHSDSTVEQGARRRERESSHRTPPAQDIHLYSDSVPEHARRRERAASHTTPPAQDIHPHSDLVPEHGARRREHASSHKTPRAQEVYSHSDSVPEQGGRRRERASSHTTPTAQDVYSHSDSVPKQGARRRGGAAARVVGSRAQASLRSGGDSLLDDDMLTPTGYLPPNTAADTAHSAHSTQPALRPHRATGKLAGGIKVPREKPPRYYVSPLIPLVPPSGIRATSAHQLSSGMVSIAAFSELALRRSLPPL